MKLLPNEEKLVSSNNDTVVLTDHRIYMNIFKFWDHSYSISIFLEDISSIEVKRVNYSIFLILSALSLLWGYYRSSSLNYFYDSSSIIIYQGLFPGIIFFLIWYFSRKHVISISSNGGASLNVTINGLNKEMIESFIYNISEAKAIRILKIRG